MRDQSGSIAWVKVTTTTSVLCCGSRTVPEVPVRHTRPDQRAAGAGRSRDPGSVRRPRQPQPAAAQLAMVAQVGPHVIHEHRGDGERSGGDSSAGCLRGADRCDVVELLDRAFDLDGGDVPVEVEGPDAAARLAASSRRGRPADARGPATRRRRRGCRRSGEL